MASVTITGVTKSFGNVTVLQEFNQKFENQGLKKLDYKISGGYIFKNNYSSASNYFFKILQKDEIIKLDNISSRIKRLPMFLSQLSKLKEDYEIIEFLPNYFIKFSKLYFTISSFFYLLKTNFPFLYTLSV